MIKKIYYNRKAGSRLVLLVYIVMDLFFLAIFVWLLLLKGSTSETIVFCIGYLCWLCPFFEFTLRAYRSYNAHFELAPQGFLHLSHLNRMYLPWESITGITGVETGMLIFLRQVPQVNMSLRRGRREQRAVIRQSILRRLFRVEQGNNTYIWGRGGIWDKQYQEVWRSYLQDYASHIELVDAQKWGSSESPESNKVRRSNASIS